MRLAIYSNFGRIKINDANTSKLESLSTFVNG